MVQGIAEEENEVFMASQTFISSSTSAGKVDDMDFEFIPSISNPHTYPPFGERSLKVAAKVRNKGSDELGGIPPDTYCPWPRVTAKPSSPSSQPPKPDVEKMMKKCKSTGSCPRRWGIRDLAIGCSKSNGKDKFLFLSSTLPSPLTTTTTTVEEKKKKKKKRKGKDGGVGGVLEYYCRNGDHRKELFLPYRKDLVGFFLVGSNLHPFF